MSSVPWCDIYAMLPTPGVFVCVLCCAVLCWILHFKNPPRRIRHYCVGVLFRKKSCQALHIYTTVLCGIQWACSASPDSCPNSAQLWRPRVEMSSFCLHCQTEKHTTLDKADLFSSAQTSHMFQSTMRNVGAHIAQHFICVHYISKCVWVWVCVSEISSAKTGKASGTTESVRLFSVLQ